MKIDFETRSEADIKKVGAWAYSEHPSTEVLCLAAEFDDGTFYQWKYGDELPEDLFFKIALGEEVHAYNVFFELSIWENICHKKMGWPKVPLHLWRDTMAKVLAHGLPRSLGSAGKFLEASKLKDEAGKKVMMKFARPMKLTKKNKEKWYWDNNDYEILLSYNMDDVISESAIDKELPNLIAKELELWKLDLKINHRGIFIDKEAVLAAIKINNEHTIKLNNELSKLTFGQVTTARQVDKLTEWLNIYLETPIESIDKEAINKALKQENLPMNVKRVLEIRRELSKSSVSKYQAFLNRLSKDCRVRGALIYHGASTGRWSSVGVQFQNLTKSSIKNVEAAVEVIRKGSLDNLLMFYDSPTDILSSCVRSMIMAPKGKDFYCADFSAIEARFVLWLADDQESLNIFRNGGDIYSVMAADIYKKRVQDVTKEERQLGKVAILGLGYGMGWKKFIETCAKWGITISEEMSKRVVNTYRTRFSKVVSFWYDCERAAIEAVRTKGQITKCGKVSFKFVGKFLYCKLPSGRCIAYFKPRLKETAGPFGYKTELRFLIEDKKFTKEEKTYGGKIVENITQAVARDAMAESMLEVEKKDYEVILTVHDEILCEADEGHGDLKEFEAIMGAVPKWAVGCPITAEGWKGKRYKK